MIRIWTARTGNSLKSAQSERAIITFFHGPREALATHTATVTISDGNAEGGPRSGEAGVLARFADLSQPACGTDTDYKWFKLDLDRSGFDLEAIRTAVERAKRSVENLDDLPVYADFDPDAFNTVFTIRSMILWENESSVMVLNSPVESSSNCPSLKLTGPTIGRRSRT